MDTALVTYAFWNVVAGIVTILLVGLIPEPHRQRSMAIVVGFASGLYWESGLGAWEYLPMLTGLALAYWGLRWYPAIGGAWLIHTANDIAHHHIGYPLAAGIPLSSFGCAIYDPVLAVWFFFGAPNLLERFVRRRGEVAGRQR